MDDDKEKPATGGDRGGPRKGVSRGAERRKDSRQPGRAQDRLTFRLASDGERLTVFGRVAQTLRLLVEVGPHGFTSGEASPLGWARRTSHYVLRLRQAGVPISTTREPAGDAVVGRYALAGPVHLEPEAGE